MLISEINNINNTGIFIICKDFFKLFKAFSLGNTEVSWSPFQYLVHSVGWLIFWCQNTVPEKKILFSFHLARRKHRRRRSLSLSLSCNICFPLGCPLNCFCSNSSRLCWDTHLPLFSLRTIGIHVEGVGENCLWLDTIHGSLSQMRVTLSLRLTDIMLSLNFIWLRNLPRWMTVCQNVLQVVQAH